MSKFTKQDREKALEIIEKEDLVLICNHVLEQTKDAEYHELDDSYVCSECRDLHSKCGKKCRCVDRGNLSMVHRSCLGI